LLAVLSEILRTGRVRLRAPQPAPIRGVFLPGPQGHSLIARGVIMARQDRFSPGQPIRSVVDLGFRWTSLLRTAALDRADPVRSPARALRWVLRRARRTRFGRDHGFEGIDGVDGFRGAVPIRTYEALWDEYLRDRYPVFEDLTWPGRIPYLALTSGTTQGVTKYIPISREMIASNRQTATTMVAYHCAAHPDSR